MCPEWWWPCGWGGWGLEWSGLSFSLCCCVSFRLPLATLLAGPPLFLLLIQRGRGAEPSSAKEEKELAMPRIHGQARPGQKI